MKNLIQGATIRRPLPEQLKFDTSCEESDANNPDEPRIKVVIMPKNIVKDAQLEIYFVDKYLM